MIEDIPEELRPVINQIAWELYRLRGYEAPEGWDFFKETVSTHPHEIEARRGAIAALCILQDFCSDNFGSDLSDLTKEQ